MNEEIMRKIQFALKDCTITKYDYLALSNYFQRLYIEASVQDNIVKYVDEVVSRHKPEELVFEE